MCLLTAGNMAIILSSDSGVVCGVLPSNVLWRINLNELKLNQVILLGKILKCYVHDIILQGLKIFINLKYEIFRNYW